MEYLDFNIRIAREEVSHTKRIIILQRSALYLNNVLAIWLIFNIYLHPTYIITAITAGICICNIFWSLSQLTLSKQDLKNEKERLSRLMEHNDSIFYKSAIEQLETTKKYYEDLIAIHSKKIFQAEENKE